jgi:type II secretory pathway pseudopilin PulG
MRRRDRTPLSGRCGGAPRRAAGVTLVEILVAVGVVAILAGLVFTVGRSALAAARQTTCQNNQRQIVLAWRLWGEEHPYGSAAGETSTQGLRAVTPGGETWADVLLDRIGEAVLHCPSRPRTDRPDAEQRGYGLNPLCGAEWIYPSGRVDRGFLLTPEGRGAPLLELVVKQHATVVFVDAGYVPAAQFGDAPAAWREDVDRPWKPYAAFPLTGPVITGAPGHVAPSHGYDWGNTLPGSGIGAMGWDEHYRPVLRHERVVCAFVDGHAEAIPIADLLGPGWGERDCLYDNQRR